jgi:iron(II)-dependent oxidoreductase
MTDADTAADTSADIDIEALRQRALTTLTTARDRTTLLTSCVDEPELPALAADVAAGLGPRAHRQPGGAVAGARRRRPGADAPDIDELYDAFEHPRADRPLAAAARPAEARQYAAEVRGQGDSTCSSHAFAGRRLTERASRSA